MKEIPVVSVVGMSGSGKTTFLEKLIVELKSRNIRVGIIKHHVHDIEIDRPGKDTWRHARAGADVVAISTPGKVAVFSKVEREMELAELVNIIGEVDIVITEGYKKGDRPKIEIARSGFTQSLISRPEELIAIVSDINWDAGVPVYGLENSAGVANLLYEIYHIG